MLFVRLNKTSKKIIFYLICIVLTCVITIYSKERRKYIKENSYIYASTPNGKEEILVLNKFSVKDKIFARKSVQLFCLVLNTNFSDFRYDNDFYWMVNSNSNGNTMYFDITPKIGRGLIFIDYRVYPQKGLSYLQETVEYGSTVFHELMHLYYLEDEEVILNLEHTTIIRMVELLNQPYNCLECKKNKNHCKIKNELDILAKSVGLLK